jgi:hypothetical protein
MIPGQQARPHTPANLILKSPVSRPAAKRPNADGDEVITGKSSSNALKTIQNKSIYHQLKSPLSPDKADQSPSYINFQRTTQQKDDEEEENIEMAINQLLIIIENNQLIDPEVLKTTLKKCLFSLSHYKLQNQILKFNSLETMKRSEIENELTEKQIDQLVLKSPLVPLNETYHPRYSSDEEGNDQTQSKKKGNFKVGKQKKSKNNSMKLVEKHNLHQKDTEFNQCIKVFHLAKR